MPKKKVQSSLFDNDDELLAWKEHWKGMPEFKQQDTMPYQKITMNFTREEDVKAFAELIGQKITYKTDTLWFPKLNLEKPSNFIYTDESDISRLHNLERSVGEEANEQCPRDFYRLNANRRIPVDSGTIFRVAEIFTDRYENIGMSGLNYTTFAQDRSERIPPYYLNTRVYSMILIDNSLPHRWRGKYNEDTDLSIRVMKDGLCTVLFNAFLGDKTQTMLMKGGNTDTIYNQGDDRLEFAKSLAEQHPDVVKVVWKFNRWHHQVDYSGFRRLNKLKFKDDIEIGEGVNNFGMVLKRVANK